MIIKELDEFRENRRKIRAYLSYIFSRNFPNYLNEIDLDTIKLGFEKISHELIKYEAFYVLDSNGYQLAGKIANCVNCIDRNIFENNSQESRSLHSYFYGAVREKRCYLTEPYPSSLNGKLCVTVSMPIYDDKGELLYVVCADISLADILKLINPSSMYGKFGTLTRVIYATLAMSLLLIAFIFFFLGIQSLITNSLHLISATQMFEATILLTLSLAIVDLAKAFFEEEVLGVSTSKEKGSSKTMVKFIASIIIALAIEALMLVFKFAMTSPDNIIYAVYLITGVAVLILSLSVYIYLTKKIQN